MSDPWKSQNNVRDFSRRIDQIADPENEKFVRGVVSRIALTCPVEVIQRIARLTVEIRREEIEREEIEREVEEN